MVGDLPRREREVLEALLRLGEGSAADLRRSLSAPLSDSAVRTLLRRLESKGFVRHRVEKQTYIFAATEQSRARESALQHLVTTFFAGSPARAASALLGRSAKPTEEELDELEALIRAAREDQG